MCSENATATQLISSALLLRVLIVDRNPVMREGLRSIVDLATDLCVVGEAHSGASTIAACLQCDPDVVLLDLQIDDLDVDLVVRHVRERRSQLPVVLMTTYPRDPRWLAARALNHVSCILKTSRHEQILDALRRAGRPDTAKKAG